jgi:hypothetical protein
VLLYELGNEVVDLPLSACDSHGTHCKRTKGEVKKTFVACSGWRNLTRDGDIASNVSTVALRGGLARYVSSGRNFLLSTAIK